MNLFMIINSDLVFLSSKNFHNHPIIYVPNENIDEA